MTNYGHFILDLFLLIVAKWVSELLTDFYKSYIMKCMNKFEQSPSFLNCLQCLIASVFRTATSLPSLVIKKSLE
jgi:hypothetical protein